MTATVTWASSGEPQEAIYDGLARADAALPAGVTVPGGPYRRLSQIPAEAWLDADGLARRIAVMTDPTAGDGGTPIAVGAERQGKYAAMLMAVHQRRHRGSFGKMMVR